MRIAKIHEMVKETLMKYPVGRARRKCQELYPELCATADVECARGLKEEEYEGYACRHT